MAQEPRPILLHQTTPRAVSQGTVHPIGELRGARLSGRFADGRNGEVTVNPGTTLGRHPNNSIRLIDNAASKQHAVIVFDSGAYLLRDLNSTNGTFVNGVRIREATRLRDGDEITIGKSKLTFRNPSDGATAKSSLPGVSVVDGGVVVDSKFVASVPQENGEFKSFDEITDMEILRNDYEKLRIANEFHRMVGLERDLGSVLDKILRVAFELLPADNAAVFFANEVGQLISHNVLRRNAKDSSLVVVSDTMLAKVVATGDAVLTSDAALDARFNTSESVISEGIRSAMAVPLASKGVLRGVLFCDTRVRTNAFSEKDLKVLAGIASQAAVALENAELAVTIEKSAVARAELSRFLAPAVAAAVVAGQVELLRIGRLAEVTTLFADIRGFTSMSETESPQETVAMLNTFFTAMANAIFKHEGNLDKFIGDCVMATWGPPNPHTDDAARALNCALEMQEAIAEINASRQAQGKAPIAVGIGVNTGQAVVGYVGSNDRHEFTAIGDVINTSSRLCGIAEGGEILASAATVSAAGSSFRAEPVSDLKVKGREQAVATYRVLANERVD